MTSRHAPSPSSRGGRKSYLLGFSLVSAAIVSACLMQSYRMETAAHGQASFRTALIGRDAGEEAQPELDDAAERSAEIARFGAAAWSLVYLLGIGAAVGPRASRLLSGNLLVLVLLLMGIEASLKIFGFHFPSLVRHTSDRNFWVYDRTKGWYHRPDATGSGALSGPDHASVRINSLGLRGGEISLHKPEGTKRVIVIGDSYAFGLGVDEEHTFVRQLETFLNARFPEDSQYQVINMGVTGYATDQEYILFQEIGMRLAPNLVILIVCDNDFLANTEDFAYKRYYKPFFELDVEGDLVLRGSPVPRLSKAQRIKLFMGQESTLWNFVRSRRSDFLAPILGFLEVDTPRTSGMSEVQITTQLVAQIADRAGAAGARFLTINTAHRGERTPLFHELRPQLEHLGINQLGLEVFLERARRDAPDMLWDFGEDKHWNRDAHRLAAEIVSGHLFRHGLLLPRIDASSR